MSVVEVGRVSGKVVGEVVRLGARLSIGLWNVFSSRLSNEEVLETLPAEVCPCFSRDRQLQRGVEPLEKLDGADVDVVTDEQLSDLSEVGDHSVGRSSCDNGSKARANFERKPAEAVPLLVKPVDVDMATC